LADVMPAISDPVLKRLRTGERQVLRQCIRPKTGKLVTGKAAAGAK
jgi:hypothetical protein